MDGLLVLSTGFQMEYSICLKKYCIDKNVHEGFFFSSSFLFCFVFGACLGNHTIQLLKEKVLMSHVLFGDFGLDLRSRTI